MESWMPRKVAPGLNAVYSMSWAFIKSTTTSEPYCGCFFSTLDIIESSLDFLFRTQYQESTRLARAISGILSVRPYLQQAALIKHFQGLGQIPLACTAGRCFAGFQRRDRLQNLLRRRRHKRVQTLSIESALELVHLFSAPAGMDAQADDARRHFVQQAWEALVVLRANLIEQAETARAHQQFAKQTLQPFGQSGIDHFERRSLIGFVAQDFDRNLECRQVLHARRVRS